MNAGIKLVDGELRERIAELVLEAAAKYGWIRYPRRRKVRRIRVSDGAYIPGSGVSYIVWELIPQAELLEKVGKFDVEAGFRAWFLTGVLGGCILEWSAKMYPEEQKTTSGPKVIVSEAGKTYKSALGRNVERFDDRKVRISQGLQTAETPAGAGGSQPWPPPSPDLGEPVGEENEHAEVGSEPISREERLQAFIVAHPGTTLADIKYSARVHTPEFQDWRNDRLKQQSLMSQRIEDVLSGAIQLKKKPPKSYED